MSTLPFSSLNIPEKYILPEECRTGADIDILDFNSSKINILRWEHNLYSSGLFIMFIDSLKLSPLMVNLISKESNDINGTFCYFRHCILHKLVHFILREFLHELNVDQDDDIDLLTERLKSTKDVSDLCEILDNYLRHNNILTHCSDSDYDSDVTDL